jgi:fatty acid CoA ligase FadD9
MQEALVRLQEALRSDPGLARSMPRPEVIHALQDDRLEAIQVLQRACAAYAGRPALGGRDFTLEPGAAGLERRWLPGFRTITYQDLWQRAVDLAAGLARDPRLALRPGEAVGILGFGSPDWVVADLACLHSGTVSAALPTGLAGPELARIAAEAKLACVICALDCLAASLPALARCPSVRGVAVMDCHPEAEEDAAILSQARARSPWPLPTLAELSGLGRGAAPAAPFLPEPGSDPPATLIYTSGSTGSPKGAVLTQRIWRARLRQESSRYPGFPSIAVNFYPMSHAMGRLAVLRVLTVGGVMHFTLKSDLSTLFEDIRLARPTLLFLVPRIAGMIHQAYRAGLQGRPGAWPAMAASFLGDRLLLAVIGSAPVAPELKAFLSDTFRIPVYEGYGSTEGGMLTVDGEINRALVSAYKLADVPELGYRTSDRPHPRGELLVKPRQGIPGYLDDDGASAALCDPEGFLRTGDIVEERAPDRIAWLDRKANVVKLAQGEFVTLGRLESTFSGGSPCLDQVYLHADGRRACILGVVVPRWQAVRERLRQEGRDAAPGAVRGLVRLELNRVAAAARLRPYEVPRDFLVEEQRWTPENGFLTAAHKLDRPRLARHYGGRLAALYARIEAVPAPAPGDLGVGATSLAEQVQQAAAAVLGVPDLDPGSGSFKDLGGDSADALSLALLLEELCGCQVPVAAILDPGRPLQSLVPLIAAHLGRDAGGLPSFKAVHGQEPARVRAGDLRLDRFLDPGELAAAAAVAAQPLEPVRTILLTGANGFLGHVLCLEWLEQAAKKGGRVVALVRAPDDQAAAARLQAAYRTGDPALERRFADLAAGHLAVRAGDLAAPGLGLGAEAYGQLAAEVDLIVHPGALVNHLLDYRQLFAPNVLGTVELIRLALRGRRKRFDFVSTLGVQAGARGSGIVAEADGIGALAGAWPARGGYACGYATSKWACEVLLTELRERFRTPLRVYRPGLILPHRRYRGQLNRQDLLSRLLAGVLLTGLAPRSFYAEGEGAGARLDGLPVDFVAAAMVALSSAFGDGGATFQFSNAHRDDGISLDTLMDWVQSAGFPVRRIDGHGAWYRAFRDRLQALPAARRRTSALPVLHQWAEPLRAGDPLRSDASRFRAEVARLRPAGEASVPCLTEAHLHRYLEDLHRFDG